MDFVSESVIAGLAASLACGLGVVPLFFGTKIERHIGLGYGFAAGLMLAAAFYNLIAPGLRLSEGNSISTVRVTQLVFGLITGAAFLNAVRSWLTPERLESHWLRIFGGRLSTLVFLSMAFHSIPEGVAVGVGYGAEAHAGSYEGLGLYIALAIGIHNMPEGLAVALPLRAEGASLGKCFVLAVASSLPQPIAAVPASLAAWMFEPLMLPMLGFAAGAMMFLVLVDLIPEALGTESVHATGWAVMIGFCGMTLVQSIL